MLYNLGAKKLSKVAVFSLRLLLGQLLVAGAVLALAGRAQQQHEVGR